MKKSKKIEGDPTPQSPIDVENNTDYELMHDYVRGNWYPSASEVVAKHKKTGTFWMTIYAIREDDSDAGIPATWSQVFPKVISVIKYEPQQ